MKRLVKVALGFTTLAAVGNVAAENVSVDVGLTAVVAASCNTADAFVKDQDLSPQIDGDGGVNVPTTGFAPVALDITNGTTITCTGKLFTSTTLTMVSLNKGIMNGSIVLPYIISGAFGSTLVADGADADSLPDATALADADVTDFDSGIGPNTDLLAGGGDSPAGTPSLKVVLKDQPVGAAKVGSYVDTLTIKVVTL